LILSIDSLVNLSIDYLINNLSFMGIINYRDHKVFFDTLLSRQALKDQKF
jgi:hypothetical protein